MLLGGQRASADPYTAYCLNEAVYMWGTHVEAILAEAGSPEIKGKEKALIRKRQAKVQSAAKTLLTGEIAETVMELDPMGGEIKALPPKKEAPTKFRDPAEIFRK